MDLKKKILTSGLMTVVYLLLLIGLVSYHRITDTIGENIPVVVLTPIWLLFSLGTLFGFYDVGDV